MNDFELTVPDLYFFRANQQKAYNKMYSLTQCSLTEWMWFAHFGGKKQEN